MTVLWRAVRSVPPWVLATITGVLALCLPFLNLDYAVGRQIQLGLILALIVSGIGLSLGYAGQLALGQAAMYAAGAYSAGVLAIRGVTDVLVQLLVSGTAALLIGLLTGVIGLRLGAWSLAMTSFFLVLMIPDVLDVFESTTGGRTGLSGIPPGTVFGSVLTPRDFFLLIVVVSLLWFAVVRNIVTSRHGVAFQVLKESEVLAASTGVSVFRMKLIGYAVGAIPAGLAGTLFANLDLFLAPTSFGLHLATSTLAAAVLGGMVSVYGPLVGALLVQLATWQAADFQEWALVVYGAFLILGGVVFGGGIAGLVRRGIRALDRRFLPEPVTDDTGGSAAGVPPLPGEELVVDGVSKAFGGNQVLTGVTLRAAPGRVTALIGPNGSGKTTLLNLVSGFYTVDDGRLRLGEVELTGLPAHQVARRGVSRTFQTPLVPPVISVRETVAAGRYSADRVSIIGALLRGPRHRAVSRRDREQVRDLLDLVGLARVADAEASSLPLGQRRLLEVARAIASRPKVLLLDEAASGLDEQEVAVLARLLGQVRDAGCAVVLVEHNFGLVLSTADEIHVLARGRLIASGPPAAIEADDRVRNEYLGIADEASVGGVA
ncbi:branched-chain amino acid ABC transporter substrate-binding protein [Actinophytocola xinjiangensis]|uniref:Branched-chain amino acid ABC transporter substrate-binding protein n=1 Tax=Actinophytocola xinjiangensis TaxID=485602 RepID=A0A7Z1B0R6_9PSEU|nr:branched-chain amino acid ABC transporter ATP-binding protein/permease [Actinophytocola xinjiangensis]OLF13900.1 branched-chain amino acid ABC transporter substrate-binding protein [Actinophytocola xinjiangensis]